MNPKIKTDELPRILRNISDILENEQYPTSASSVCQAADTIEQLIGKLAEVEAVNAATQSGPIL